MKETSFSELARYIREGSAPSWVMATNLLDEEGNPMRLEWYDTDKDYVGKGPVVYDGKRVDESGIFSLGKLELSVLCNIDFQLPADMFNYCEKQWLRRFLRPWRDQRVVLRKRYVGPDTAHLTIRLEDYVITLPPFNSHRYYVDMVQNVWYNVKDIWCDE